MKFIKTKGIVIKEINTGDADRVLIIFTKEHGVISAYARGVRKIKSNLASGAQFLSYSDYLLIRGKEMYLVSSSELINSFYEIRNDLIKLTYASHIADILHDVIMENQPSRKILKLYLNYIHILSRQDKLPQLITSIIELKILTILGYAPCVQRCVKCNNIEFLDIYFDFKNCGFICSNCLGRENNAVKISMGTAKAINYIVTADIGKVFNFNVSTEVLNELQKVVSIYLRERLEKNYNKLDFLKKIDLQEEILKS